MNTLLQPTLLAFDGAEFMALCIPLVALMIPIVALLIHHQQKMAQIIHGQGVNPKLSSDIEALHWQIQQLQSQIAQHAAALEKMGALAAPQPPAVANDLQERLRS